MKVIKRDGHMVDWCPEKIEIAVEKANKEVVEEDQASNIQIKNIIKYIDKDLQVFITSTDLNNIDKKIVKNATIFKIDNGKVIEGD